MKMNENYNNVLELCKVIIERDYVPCSLEKEIKKRLLELTQELERHGAKGFDILSRDVHRAVNHAKSMKKT